MRAKISPRIANVRLPVAGSLFVFPLCLPVFADFSLHETDRQLTVHENGKPVLVHYNAWAKV